ncbi:hypothetical protein [Halobacterium zhouii]|uniref:hypothetical protein n=1 Tax=Halobacterium zhouii TaxID=2902624 RepID=UPI001E346A18|nr:hypothetical protein [Halobacterium zhouii]
MSDERSELLATVGLVVLGIISVAAMSLLPTEPTVTAIMWRLTYGVAAVGTLLAAGASLHLHYSQQVTNDG